MTHSNKWSNTRGRGQWEPLIYSWLVKGRCVRSRGKSHGSESYPAGSGAILRQKVSEFSQIIGHQLMTENCLIWEKELHRTGVVNEVLRVEGV
jgi:hypothetical protein